MIYILIYLFIQQVILFITKRKPDVLCCGLWGYSGKEPASPHKVKILALYNETRGDQATGVCVDDLVIKDTVNAKEFMVKHRGALDFEGFNIKNRIILGHCRQASAAFNRHSVAEAHPHSTTRNNKDFLRLIHNGTINNTADLAYKYGMEHLGKTDSMLLAEIITALYGDKKLDVLREYRGAATVVFYSVNKANNLYFHRDFLRELYYWNETENSCYFSSMKEGLIAIGAQEEEIIEFKPGFLMRFFNGKKMEEWDMTNKVVYEKPKPVKEHKSHVNNNKAWVQVPKETTKLGFYWDNYVLKFTGHAYTGELYVSKETGEGFKKSGLRSEAEFDKYWVFAGHIMKDKAAYNALHVHCTVKEKLDFVVFNNMLTSVLQLYTKYPVVAKIYASDPKDIFFWSLDLDKLESAKDRHDWTLPMSNQTNYVDRTGHLTAVTEAKRKYSTNAQLIEQCVTEKMEGGSIYTNPLDLMNDFYAKKPTGTQKSIYNFVEATIRYLDDSTTVNAKDIASMKAELESDYGSRIEKGEIEGWPLLNMITTHLRQTQVALKVTNYDDFSDNDDQVSAIIAQSERSPDSAYFETQSFKNDILFEHYEGVEDIVSNYCPDGKTKECLVSLMRFFKTLGLTSFEDVEKAKTTDPKDLIRIVDRIYKELVGSKNVMTIANIFNSSDINKAYATIHERHMELEARNSLNKEEESELELLKVAVKWVLERSEDNANGINKVMLEDLYGIKQEDLEAMTC